MSALAREIFALNVFFQGQVQKPADTNVPAAASADGVNFSKDPG